MAVLSERRGDIAVITLNRPERRNGVTLEMTRGLYRAAREVAESDAMVCVLRGAGNDFCVGADISPELGKVEGKMETDDLGPIYHGSEILHTMPQISIAAIDGGCAGAGMGWAAACDFRFATPEARFATAFLNVGATGDMGTGWSLARILGGARARELMLFPDKFDGARALEIGLVTRLFAREDLHREVMALAGQLAARDPVTLRMMKANALSAEELPLGEYIEIETKRHLESTSRPGFAEAMMKGLARATGKS